MTMEDNAVFTMTVFAMQCSQWTMIRDGVLNGTSQWAMQLVFSNVGVTVGLVTGNYTTTLSIDAAAESAEYNLGGT